MKIGKFTFKRMDDRDPCYEFFECVEGVEPCNVCGKVKARFAKPLLSGVCIQAGVKCECRRSLVSGKFTNPSEVAEMLDKWNKKQSPTSPEQSRLEAIYP